MESKKINQLATSVAPVSTDLTIIGDPITGVSKKITLLQLASIFAGLIGFYTNYAAFPATGTINIIYCAKDTQKLYLWSGSAYVEIFPSQALLNTYQLISEKGVSNGYASLDSGGKVPIAQLPASIMEYKGMWNASTNSPTLANGTGDTGDVYICNVAGSVNFGAGVIVFAVGDYVIYSGSIWQRSSGAVGTVTSVGLSSATSGVTIGSTPITTSGTITLAIANATTSQNGLLTSTDWATFNGKQSTITLTTTGTSGAATFVSNTINIPNYGSALTGYVPYTGATQDVDLGAFKLNAQSLHAKGTAGNGHLGLKHQSASATASANEVSLFADVNGDLGWQNGNLYLSKFIISSNTAARSYTFPNANGTVALTSDLSGFVTSVTGTSPIVSSGGTTPAISIPAATTSVNGYLTSTDWTTFNSKQATITLTTTGSSGAATLVGATLNIPDYGSALSGYVTLATAQTITGEKSFTSLSKTAFTSGIIISNTASGGAASGHTTIGANVNGLQVNFPTGGYNNLNFASTTVGNTYTFPNATGTIALVGGSGVGTVTSVAALTLGTTGTDLSSTVANSTTTPVITLNVPTASATNRGALSSADWTTFNNKQSTITNPVTGTGTTNTLSKFTSTSVIGNSMVSDDGTTLTSLGATRSNLYIKAVNDTYYGQLAFTNGTNASYGGISYNNSGQYMQFETNTSEWMRLSSTGNLSIGNTNNTYKLDVSGTGRFTGAVRLGTDFAQLLPISASNYQLLVGNYYDGTNIIATATEGSRTVYNVGGMDFRTFTGATVGNTVADTSRMVVTSAGNVLLGTTTDNGARLKITPSTLGISILRIGGYASIAGSTDFVLEGGTSGDKTIYFNPYSLAPVVVGPLAGTGSRAVLADASGTLSAPVSDISVKQNIISIGYGLNEILKMNPVWFDFIDGYKNYGEGRQNGNIAQEMEKIIPEAVFTTPTTGKMGINYDQLHAVYIKAIQELKLEIEELKLKIK